MKYGMIIFILIISMGCSGCIITNGNNNSIRTGEIVGFDKNHDLTITIGDENIKCVSLSYSQDSNSENDKNIFKFAFKQDTLPDIKYIKLNNKIILNFGKNPPDSVAVKDMLLNSDGEYLYPDKLSTENSLTNEDNEFSFLLHRNPASLLSAKFDNTRMEFRGFKITATWGQDEESYAFVIKSNGID